MSYICTFSKNCTSRVKDSFGIDLWFNHKPPGIWVNFPLFYFVLTPSGNPSFFPQILVCPLVFQRLLLYPSWNFPLISSTGEFLFLFFLEKPIAYFWLSNDFKWSAKIFFGDNNANFYCMDILWIFHSFLLVSKCMNSLSITLPLLPRTQCGYNSNESSLDIYSLKP